MPDDAMPTLLSLRTKGRGPAPKGPRGQMALGLADAPAAVAAKKYVPIVLEVEAARPVAPGPVREPVLYTVRQLIGEVRRHLEGGFGGMLNVEGEISNCRPAASGHLYFTLKDGDAQLPVVMFRRQAHLLGWKPKDGMAVEARGRISVYETRGQLQLIGETLRPRGTGALQLAFEQLRDRLRREGLFETARKRALPPYPHCIGIVTSTGGAALKDFLKVVRRRHARLNVLVYPAVMQGAQCPATVAAGIRWFNRHPERVDLIVIARGGGSLEDLAGFNDEVLARVIVGSGLPVVSAIGHEIDNTIADFVADLRAPTPSAAAEMVTAAQHRIEERVAGLARRVERAGMFHLMTARQRFSRLSAEYVLARLRDQVGLKAQRVDELGSRLESAVERRMRHRGVRVAQLEARLRRQEPTVRVAQARQRMLAADGRLAHLASTLVSMRRTRVDRAGFRLEALSPLAVLHRGYAIVYGPGGIVRDAGEVTAGQEIRARVARGSVRAVVQASDSTNTKENAT